MRRDELRVFERAAGFQIGGYPRGAEHVTADPDGQAELGGAALDHPVGIDPVHSLDGQTPDAKFYSSACRQRAHHAVKSVSVADDMSGLGSARSVR